jgi:L-alanine-DL-glutamate epimerase-like enolase superfamily enzyme
MIVEKHNRPVLRWPGFREAWKQKDPLAIAERMNELHGLRPSMTIKSAFDMALYDIAAKVAGKPLYKPGGRRRNWKRISPSALASLMRWQRQPRN